MAKITEIPDYHHAALVGNEGKGGIKDAWYERLATMSRADRPAVQDAFAKAYQQLFDLPAPQFVWMDTPGDDDVDVEAHGGAVDIAKYIDAVQETLLSPFHPVLAKYIPHELLGKPSQKGAQGAGDALTGALEAFNRVFTGNDSSHKTPYSALVTSSFLVVKALLTTFVKESPDRFPDLKMDAAKQALVLDLCDAVAAVYGFVATKQQCIIFERPTKVYYEDTPRGKQIHNERGPAIEFSAGKGRYLLDGIVVPEHVVLRPETITINEIEQNDNIEVRRLMIGRRGVGWYLTETKAEVLHQDTVKVFSPSATVDPDDLGLSMPRALLRDKNKRIYLCGTDGSTDRVYYMMCPGHVTTCAEAHQQLSGGLDERKCVAQS